MALPKNKWLETVYTQLGYVEGELHPAVSIPDDATIPVWTDKGDWLTLADRICRELEGAKIDQVFFVGNNPTIVFGECVDDEKIFKRLFQRVWCMARPSLLFLAFREELRVYSLNSIPQRDEEGWKAPRPLERVKKINEVYEKLNEFRRDEIETGRFFHSGRMKRIHGRADIQLIRDLKVVRAELMKMGLSQSNLKYAHSLIGRSIFIRYLEDRGVLTEKYFREVADIDKTNKWNYLLDIALNDRNVLSREKAPFYLCVLSNKEFTYALWDKLSKDFNGDIFPQDKKENEIITEAHLELVQRFMLGDTGPQRKLFLWAYDFDIVPIELISSIYEEFYHKESAGSKKKGTYYTPSALVEFVLSRVLTEEVLSQKPRIIDPACGSGIFLVESFRRIVRYRVKRQKGTRLKPNELRDILRKQIAGIEITEDAVRIAAFSLCLAFLDYLEPPDILEQVFRLGRRLPILKVCPHQETDEEYYNILLEADSFDIKNQKELTWFGAQCADVVVGNPPWGDMDETTENWCRQKDRPVGDKEYSQAFIWRTLELLKKGGVAGLLVSSGVLFKRNPTSQLMRKQWLEETELVQVVNFVHVREIFFTGGTSPFVYVEFRKGKTKVDTNVQYWSAKRTAAVDGQQAVILSKPDLRIVKQSALKNDDFLWKVYWWGSHRDAALIKTLSLYPTLGEIVEARGWPKGYGFQGPRSDERYNMPSDFVKNYRVFPTEAFTRYGPINQELFADPPDMLYRKGNEQVYKGWRILIKRGVGCEKRITARLDSVSYCFKHSIYGINMSKAKAWERKVLLGILWSSLARYYLFHTGASWGTWHDSVHLDDDTLSLPICFPEDAILRKNIVQVVDRLRSLGKGNSSLLFDLRKEADQKQLEQELDELIFELYQLTDLERDIIWDLCQVDLECFYQKSKSKAYQSLALRPVERQGLYRDLPRDRHQQDGLEGYLKAFLKIWNQQFDQKGELWWRIVGLKRQSPMIAVILTTKGMEDQIPTIDLTDEQQWSTALRQLSQNIMLPYKTDRIYIDGMVRFVSDTDILIIKRNERRLWTRSKALEDAEATMLQAIHLQQRGQL